MTAWHQRQGRQDAAADTLNLHSYDFVNPFGDKSFGHAAGRR